LQLAAGDPADVEQVVDQPHQVLNLAVEQVTGTVHGRIPCDLMPHDLDGIADRHQRVAQFVRKGGEKLVLAAIGLAQCLLRRLALGDVDIDPVDALRIAHGVIGGRSPASRFSWTRFCGFLT